MSNHRRSYQDLKPSPKKSFLLHYKYLLIFILFHFFTSVVHLQESSTLSFKSASLEGESVSSIIRLPNGYDENDPEQKYRLFIILHGSIPNSAGIVHSSFRSAIDELIKKEEVEPFVAVFPALITNKVPDYNNVHSI